MVQQTIEQAIGENEEGMSVSLNRDLLEAINKLSAEDEIECKSSLLHCIAELWPSLNTDNMLLWY